MKNFLAVVAIALSVLVIYTVHQDRVREAAEAAEAAQPPGRSFGFQAKAATPLSQALQPYLETLFGNLDPNNAQDLVPPLQIIRERIAQRRTLVETHKQPIIDAGLRCLDLIIPAAEERTQSLDAVIRIAMRPPSALDAHGTSSDSNAFFLQTATRRWESERNRRKPAIDQAVAYLRRVEEEWKKHYGETVRSEDFFAHNLPPVYVRVEERVGGDNPLERSAYNHHRPWRRTYYDQFGQGYSVRY